jgi:hypothetical protein
MEHHEGSSRLSSVEPAHGRATDPQRRLAGQEGWRTRPHKKGLGTELRDGGSSLAVVLPDRRSTNTCQANESETYEFIAPALEPAAGYPSFAEIMKRLDASTALSSIAKRDLKSAIKRIIGTWMGRDLTMTPADIPWLRKQMADWTAARFGVSEGTFNTVRSQLNRALKVAGIRQSRVRHRILGGRWKELDEALKRHWTCHRQTDGKPPGDN